LVTGLIVALVRLTRAWDYDRLPQSGRRLVGFATRAAIVGLFWGLVGLCGLPCVINFVEFVRAGGG
jgi:hypothetical protein